MIGKRRAVSRFVAAARLARATVAGAMCLALVASCGTGQPAELTDAEGERLASVVADSMIRAAGVSSNLAAAAINAAKAGMAARDQASAAGEAVGTLVTLATFGGNSRMPGARVPAVSSGEGLAWLQRASAAGNELPGGGLLLFPARRIVALYGHPSGPALGVLGEQDVGASVTRAKGLAAEYQALTDDLVIPGFEIIATVASGRAGDDGNYSNEWPVETLRPYVDAARQAGIYVVLDLQPGRSDFLTQAKMYEELLREPHVGLALDPEWRLTPEQLPLRQIGSVHIDEVNETLNWLADLTREHALPQKLLILHQFRLDMIVERERLDLTRDELAVMVHADGQGAQGSKQNTWKTLRADAPEGLWWGWKNFYDEDSPAVLTPAETLTLVDPIPNLISYQ